MAFQPSNAAATNRNSNSNSNCQPDSWKAQGFLNLYLPNKEGKRVKLGAIPLKESKHSEKQMLDWLKEDPSRVATILAKLELEFKSTEVGPNSGFDLT